MNYYLVSLGSNINADECLPKALNLINNDYDVISYSHVLQNPACGAFLKSPFHNQLLLLKSSQKNKQLKMVFEQFEIELGREAKSPERKYKDRTIDIDILSQASSPQGALAVSLQEPYNQILMNEWQLPAFP
jgi:2-amino-4-hydroxy-6-hydroxymethyldihydropteridine diphosphokinase